MHCSCRQPVTSTVEPIAVLPRDHDACSVVLPIVSSQIVSVPLVTAMISHYRPRCRLHRRVSARVPTTTVSPHLIDTSCSRLQSRATLTGAPQRAPWTRSDFRALVVNSTSAKPTFSPSL
ncbi:hypothetical protein Salat_1130800 [Sesamum alatum]|uniref:Uncharacterized protein n=1 Tax=Sesamum alatum TaxID=300844 RepID=A0AAE2CN45_9LAMI|nr:hypothetical protein Salat_1130800 [Sesamum alatum]